MRASALELPSDDGSGTVEQRAVSARALRVLFFTWNYFPAPCGGAERQAKLQAEELVKRGHHVTVVCPATSGLKSADINGVDVRRIFRIERPRLQRVTYLLSLVWFAVRNLAKFDVVHVHLANLQADVIVPLARLWRRPVYVKVACGGTAGEVARFERVARVTRWVGLRHATKVQALSDEIVAELRSIGVRSDRIVEISNGYDERNFSRVDRSCVARLRESLGLPVDDVILLYVGRFAVYKGVLDLVAAWRERPISGATLVLVGAGDTDKNIGEIEPTAGMIVRPWTNDVLPYLRAADVFVYPSHADGMSNALLEAMACGCAVIATRSGTADVMLADGGGVLIDARDRSALREAMELLAGNDELRAKLADKAAASAPRYEIPNVVRRIESVYHEMVTS